MEESRSRNGVGLVGSATSFPTRAADSVSDSARHLCSSFQCVIRSVSTCPPRGNLVDGLPRAPSLEKAHSIFATIWLVETEIHLLSKSNTL